MSLPSLANKNQLFWVAVVYPMPGSGLRKVGPNEGTRGIVPVFSFVLFPNKTMYSCLHFGTTLGSTADFESYHTPLLPATNLRRCPCGLRKHLKNSLMPSPPI